MIRVLARAKINLSLEVLGRRDDGYHDLATVLQSITMADELTVRPDADLTFACDVERLNTPDNLVYQAARLLRNAAGVSSGAHIMLRKGIPDAAGLGGGSADAAAALVALDRLWRVGLTEADFVRLGVSLGSDVPFFVGDAGTSLAEGRGELLHPLTPAPHAWIVLALPAVPLPERKTASAFNLLPPALHSSGGRAHRWRDRLAQGAGWPDLLHDPGLHNAFEAVMTQAFPGIERARDLFAEVVAGAAPVALSGAGPALFALLQTEDLASRVHRRLQAQSLPSFVVETADRPLVVMD